MKLNLQESKFIKFLNEEDGNTKILTFVHKWAPITLVGKSEADIENQLRTLGCPASTCKNLLKDIKPLQEAFKGKDISQWVKQIWMLPSKEDKILIFKEMLKDIDFKGRNAMYLTQVEKMSPTKIDQFVSNLSLKGEELGTYK